MTLDAYAAASSGSRLSPELELIELIDRFGVEAVLGRKQLSANEIKTMRTAENVYNAYLSRKQAASKGEWVLANPYWTKVLDRLDREAANV